jgi:hypothetical protein
MGISMSIEKLCMIKGTSKNPVYDSTKFNFTH